MLGRHRDLLPSKLLGNASGKQRACAAFAGVRETVRPMRAWHKRAHEEFAKPSQLDDDSMTQIALAPAALHT
jgi:hypothetical protein